MVYFIVKECEYLVSQSITSANLRRTFFVDYRIVVYEYFSYLYSLCTWLLWHFIFPTKATTTHQPPPPQIHTHSTSGARPARAHMSRRMPADIRIFFGGGPKKPAATGGGGDAKPKEEPPAATIKSPTKAVRREPDVDMVDLTEAVAVKTTPRAAAVKRKVLVDVRGLSIPLPHPSSLRFQPPKALLLCAISAFFFFFELCSAWT